MLLKQLFASQILQRTVTLTNVLVNSSKHGYHGSNYEPTPGKCVQVRDKQTTKCLAKYIHCKPIASPKPSDMSLWKDYSEQLMRILRPKQIDCELIKHDICYYQPSNKSRRYQRTWPECAMIYLQPKKACCFDREYYTPSCRRPRSPPVPPLTATQKHAFHMALLGTNCKLGTKLQLKCLRVRRHLNCKKEVAPFPCFSESDQAGMRGSCPTECGCRVSPSMCEAWSAYHRNSGLVKRCTEAIVGYCPFKSRSRPLS
ncbi:GH20819 [Drosophila grimshawi]|uniref:GH20819 n=1 Tax=Drosophila grimshawi TaxID=7222 RepID=B4J5V8_DROGR|nr:GH20819 [Drosophila grimshawi]